MSAIKAANTIIDSSGGEETNTQDFIEDLIRKMTLSEKIGQMTQYDASWDVTGPPVQKDDIDRYEKIAEGRVGAMLNILGTEATREAQKIAVENSRLGIPLLFGYDVVHGYKTMFPIPIADACSWDLTHIENATRIAATEATAAGLNWAFAPMMDISRDARWGRVMEGAGEDPYLVSKVSAARVKGFQGEDLSKPDTMAATAKHFAAYGFLNAALEYNTTEISDNTFLNQVLPPFKAAIDAGVSTVMNAFSDFNGIPVTANSYLQRDILKKELGFKGFIITDYSTISEMVVHQYAKDNKDAAYKAIIAGTDMDMESRVYENNLEALVNEGAVEEKMIDDAVRRILTLKLNLGLFDDPYRYCDESRSHLLEHVEDHHTKALEAAKSSAVLLKNDKNLLPIRKSVKTIGVIGKLADDKDAPLGSWRARTEAQSGVSILEGLQKHVPSETEILFAKWYTLSVEPPTFTQEVDLSQSDDESGFTEALEVAERSDLVLFVLGEECFQTGEGRSQTFIGLKGAQLKLLKKVYAINKNVVAIMMNGRPIAEPWLYENIPSILESWYLGSQSGNAIAELLTGKCNPSGKLALSIPRSIGQIPISYNHTRTGRPDPIPGDPNFVFWSHYSDCDKTPQYAFGHGLSYTTFEYSNLKLNTDTISMDESLTVSIEVENTGSYDGEEVVQLYINDLYSSTIRPVKELKGFEKLHFKAGEKKTVTFTIGWKDLAFYGADRIFKAEPGEFDVMVGGNSEDLLSARFELTA